MNRKINFSDELLLQYGSTMAAYLDTDPPLFTSFDKDLIEYKALAERTLSNIIKNSKR